MTKLIIETDDNWTREKIKLAIGTETHLLKKSADKIQNKVKGQEKLSFYNFYLNPYAVASSPSITLMSFMDE